MLELADPETADDGQDAALEQAASEAVKRIHAPPSQDDEEAALDAAAERTAGLIQTREPSVWEKAAIGASENMGAMMQAPELASKAAEYLGIPHEKLQQLFPNLMEGAQKLADVGREMQAASEEASPPTTRGEGIGAQLPYVVGGFAPTLAASALGGEIAPFFGVPARIGQLAGVGASSAATTAVQLHAEVMAATGDEGKAMAAAALGLGIGATDMIGAGGILSKLERASAGGLTRFLGKVAMEGLEEGLQNATQEGLTDAVRTTLTPQDLTFLERLDHIGKAGALGLVFGGLIGAAFHGAAEGAHAAKGRGKAQEGQGGAGPPTAQPGEPGGLLLGGQEEAPARELELNLAPDGPAAKAVEEARGQAQAPSESPTGAQPAPTEPSAVPPEGERRKGLNLGPADLEAEQGLKRVARDIQRHVAGGIDPELLTEAGTDPLTGLANRRTDREHYDRVRKVARRKGDRVVRMFGDLDNFKAVNTEFGDAGGDRAIQIVAEAWKKAAAEGQGVLPARKGGDEFVTTIRVSKDADVDAIRDHMEAIAADALEQAGMGTAMGKKIAASIGWVEVAQDEDLVEVTKRAAIEAKKRKVARGVSKTTATGERAEEAASTAPAEGSTARGVPEAVPPTAGAEQRDKVSDWLGRMAEHGAREVAAEGLADHLIENEENGDKTKPLDLAEPFFAPGGAYQALDEKGRASLEKAVLKVTGAKPGDTAYVQLKPDGTHGESVPYKDVEDIVRAVVGDYGSFRDLKADDRRLFGLLMQLGEAERQHQAGVNPATKGAKPKLEEPAPQLAEHPLSPEEEVSDRILRGEPVTIEDLTKAPKAMKRAAVRQQRGEKPREAAKPKAEPKPEPKAAETTPKARKATTARKLLDQAEKARKADDEPLADALETSAAEQLTPPVIDKPAGEAPAARESYGERYIRENGAEAAKRRVIELETKAFKEANLGNVRGVENLSQEAENIRRALGLPITTPPAPIREQAPAAEVQAPAPTVAAQGSLGAAEGAGGSTLITAEESRMLAALKAIESASNGRGAHEELPSMVSLATAAGYTSKGMGSRGKVFLNPDGRVEMRRLQAKDNAEASRLDQAQEIRERERIHASVAAGRAHDARIDAERAAAAAAPKPVEQTPAALRARAEELVRAFRVTAAEPEAEVAAPTAPGQIPTGSFRFPTGRVEVGEDHGSGAQVRIFFDAKPTPEKLAELRKAGFRWNGASKAWIIEGGKGGQAKALEITGMDQPQTSTVEERIADLERRIKAKEADRKGRRRATQAGINREIRTLEEIIGKLQPTAEKRRRAREEFERQGSAVKARERGESTEQVLARIQFADQGAAQEAAQVFNDWVRAEAAGKGLTEAELKELTGEAARFFQLGPPPGSDLAKLVPRTTTMAEYVSKAAPVAQLQTGLRDLNARMASADKEANRAGAFVTDYSVKQAIDRAMKENDALPPLERLEAVRKAAEPAIGRLLDAAHAKQREKIEAEVAKEEERWKTLAEGTQEWEAFHAADNPYLKKAWTGGMVTEDPDAATDGRLLLKKSAIEGKRPLQFFSDTSEQTRYGTGNPLPKRGTEAVWNQALEKKPQPATVKGVLAPESAEGYTIAMVFRNDGKGQAAVDAFKLRAMMRATKADGVSMSEYNAPVVVTKAGKPVGIIMPITIDEAAKSGTPRGDTVSGALRDGGVPALRKLAAEKLAEAQRTGEEKIRNIGREQPPEDIRKLHAFPGGLLDPLMAAAQRTVDRLRKTPPLQEGAAPLPTANWTAKAIQRYVDYFEPVQRAERALAGERRPGEANLPDEADAYLQETLRKGRTGNLLEKLEKEHRDPFLALMRSKRITPSEADEFVMARNAHAGNKLIRERNPEDVGEALTRYGMTDEEADEILAKVKADPRAAAFEELGQRFDAVNKATLDRHVESGRMTAEQAAALLERQPHYAPARTDMRGPDGEPIQVPSGQRRVGKPFQKALGRESRAEHPIAFAFAQAEQAIAQGEINKTRQAFLSMVRAYQDQIGDAIRVVEVPMRKTLVNGEVKETFDPFWRGRNDVVVAWEKGKPIGMEIAPEHADLAKALNQLGPNQIEGATKLAASFNRMRAAMITRYRPFFWPRNMVRDVKAAAYLGSEFGVRHAARTVADVPRALATLAGKKTDLTPYVERYKAAGAPITYLGLRDLEAQLNKMEAALADPDALSTDKNVEGFKMVKAAMEKASDIGENATRFSAFVHAIEDLGWSDERAAAYAKELQNFERKGLHGATLSAWYLFANAGIQTGRRLSQAMRNPAVRRTVAMSFVAAMGWDVLQRALGGQAPDGEDWWDKVPEYEKQGNFIFMYPDGSGRRVNIPAPFAFGAFNYTGQQLGALLTGNIGPGKFVASSTAAWVNALNPLGSIAGDDAQGLARSLTPDIGRLPLELATNRDWRGKQIAPEGSSHSPAFTRAWPDTNPLAKAVSEWANSVSGGNKYEPGSVDVSPEALEHVAEFFGSGLPQDVLAVGQQSLKKARGEPIHGRDIPLLKQIIRDPSPFASWNEQEDLLYSLKAERKRAEDENRMLSKDARAVIELGDAVRLDREHSKNPKAGKGTPLDELSERAKQQELQRLDIQAMQWNRKAREALRKLVR